MVWGVFFEYCVRHGVSLGVFLEYFLSISAETPKITEIVFFEYFWGIRYFPQCSDQAQYNARDM